MDVKLVTGVTANTTLDVLFDQMTHYPFGHPGVDFIGGDRACAQPSCSRSKPSV
ncbi:hypothetical protein ACWDUL_03045 [Nocardia niigatensis]|uniref:hypothetical protein n=1 Tax=Nocardia niigatensis TaxID=209249 RepID=UPI000309EAD0|nr:hypothetical protein [Nocardia niigatensis]